LFFVKPGKEEIAMKLIKPDDDYIEKAKLLSADEIERLLARMRGKLSRRLDNEKLSATEAAAIQLQLEDEQLMEWRERMAEITKGKERNSHHK
jgi:hypothetical protein